MVGKLFSGLGWLGAAGAVAVLAYAQYRSNETGRDVVSILKNLPDELKHSQVEWQQRFERAVSEGKQAAAEREAEIESELAGGKTAVQKQVEKEEFPEFIV